jgi:hypothetical protein
VCSLSGLPSRRRPESAGKSPPTLACSQPSAPSKLFWRQRVLNPPPRVAFGSVGRQEWGLALLLPLQQAT